MPYGRVYDADGADGRRIDIGPVEYQLPGDYNRDGSVDAADYVVWRKTVGQTGYNLLADGRGPAIELPDGIVDPLDHSFWSSKFGNALTTGSGTGASSAIATSHNAGGVSNSLAAGVTTLPKSTALVSIEMNTSNQPPVGGSNERAFDVRLVDLAFVDVSVSARAEPVRWAALELTRVADKARDVQLQNLLLIDSAQHPDLPAFADLLRSDWVHESNQNDLLNEDDAFDAALTSLQNDTERQAKDY